MYTHTYCIYIYNVLYRSVFLSPLLPTTLYMYVYIHMWSQCTPQFTSERESANLILGHEVSSPPPNSCWIIDCLDGFPVDIKGVYMYICGYIYMYICILLSLSADVREIEEKKNFFILHIFSPHGIELFFFALPYLFLLYSTPEIRHVCLVTRGRYFSLLLPTHVSIPVSFLKYIYIYVYTLP